VYDAFDIGWGWPGFVANPAIKINVGFGYDPYSYIATAKLAPYPYTTQDLIVARYGSLADLIAATDDTGTGNIDSGILAGVIKNVTSDINGYLTTVYPIPLAQTGTVAILKVSTVSSDGLGTVTGLTVVEPGNYAVAPGTDNFPAYLRYLDPLANEACFGGCGWSDNCWNTQKGTGLELTVAYAAVTLPSFGSPVAVSGTPTIVAGGLNYCVGDLLVLTGGQSYVPDKITSAATLNCCYELSRRRLAPEEKNLFADEAARVKKELLGIGNGTLDLDGTYKRYYSSGQSWTQLSVLNANSL